MMVVRPALVIAMLAALALPAHAEDRSVLLNCKAMVERAEKDANAVGEADLTRCRQVIREWALRDARTIVDEEGKPLR
jgi:predicted TIM-barrel enzyme